MLPAGQLAKLEFDRSPPQIQRYNRERTVIVSAYTQTGFNTDKVTQDVIARLQAMDWPRGYRFDSAARRKRRRAASAGLAPRS
jgi:multidrug efflux pump subunit AcrB